MGKYDIIVVNGHGVGEYCDVKRIPVAGETARASNRRFEEDAGKGTNVAVAIARMGGKVAFLGKAGDDPAGKLGEKWMREAGVDISHFWLDPSIETDLGLVVVAEDGTNLCIDFDDDRNNLQVDEAREHLPQMVGEARYLISGFSVSKETGLFAVKYGKELGLTTMFNPSPLVEGTEFPEMPFVDYLFVNETEAHIMMDLPKEQSIEDYMDIAKAIRERYKVGTVIITLGSEGSIAYDGKDTIRVPARKVQMVDQTGAGDGYMAAVTWRLSEGAKLGDAMKWASVYCGYLVTQFGSLGSYPEKAVIDTLFSGLQDAVG